MKTDRRHKLSVSGQTEFIGNMDRLAEHVRLHNLAIRVVGVHADRTGAEIWEWMGWNG